MHFDWDFLFPFDHLRCLVASLSPGLTGIQLGFSEKKSSTKAHMAGRGLSVLPLVVVSVGMRSSKANLVLV